MWDFNFANLIANAWEEESFRLSILSMFVVNEQISMSINDAPNVVKSALKDAEFFIKSSNHQMQAETFESFDRTREKIKIDLEG